MMRSFERREYGAEKIFGEEEIFRWLAERGIGRLQISEQGRPDLPPSAIEAYRKRGVPISILTLDGTQKEGRIHIASTDPKIRPLPVSREALSGQVEKEFEAVKTIVSQVVEFLSPPGNKEVSKLLNLMCRRDVLGEMRRVLGKEEGKKRVAEVVDSGFLGGPFCRFDALVTQEGRVVLPDRTFQCTGWGRALPRVDIVLEINGLPPSEHFPLLGEKVRAVLEEQGWKEGRPVVFLGKGGGEYTTWEVKKLSKAVGALIQKIPICYFGLNKEGLLDERWTLEWLVREGRVQIEPGRLVFNLPDGEVFEAEGILFGSGLENTKDGKVIAFLRDLFLGDIPLCGHPFLGLLFENKGIRYALDPNQRMGKVVQLKNNNLVEVVVEKGEAQSRPFNFEEWEMVVIKPCGGSGSRGVRLAEEGGQIKRFCLGQRGRSAVVERFIPPEGQHHLLIFNPQGGEEVATHARYEIYFIPDEKLPPYHTFTARPNNPDFKVHGATDCVFGVVKLGE